MFMCGFHNDKVFYALKLHLFQVLYGNVVTMISYEVIFLSFYSSKDKDIQPKSTMQKYKKSTDEFED